MRLAILIATALACCITPALADEKPAVDLVATFVLGIAPGETLGLFGDGTTMAVMEQSGPGAFHGTPANNKPFGFDVTEKSKCVFDIKFSQESKFVAGIEVDATKFKAMTYEKGAEHPPITDYAINLVGGDNVVRRLGETGELSGTSSNSRMSTSLSVDAMQAAVTAFQTAYWPAA